MASSAQRGFTSKVRSHSGFAQPLCTRMAAASEGVTRDQLMWTHDAYIREDTYRAALASTINAHHRLPFAAVWGSAFVADGILSFDPELPAAHHARAFRAIERARSEIGSDPVDDQLQRIPELEDLFDSPKVRLEQRGRCHP